MDEQRNVGCYSTEKVLGKSILKEGKTEVGLSQIKVNLILRADAIELFTL